MSEESRRNDLTRKPIVYSVPGMDAVTVRRDIEYRATEDGSLTMDLYLPPVSEDAEPRPAVVLVSGYPDPGFERVLGCKFKEVRGYVSWGRLLAASGLMAVTYTNGEPVGDLSALLRHLRKNAMSLGIDEDRIGVWACSGNVPLTLSVLMGEAGHPCQCAVLCYGYMLDLDGSTAVADAAAQFGFTNPCAGKSVDDLSDHVPLLVVRAGQDEMPGLNETIDRFVAGALGCNLPVTLVNHPRAPHAFDLLDDTETSRRLIRQIVTFLRSHLLLPDTTS